MLTRLNPQLLLDGLSIVLIDLLLAGDNALVIAMAVRALPARQRKIAIAFGAATAVVLRIALTVVAGQILGIRFLKLLGGAFILWIAVKVLTDASSPPSPATAERHVLATIWVIVVADLTMSTDNILAVAGAAHGSIPLIILGLCISIPFVVFSSNLIAILMDRYSWVIYVGAAILGKIGAEMILTDPFVDRLLHPSQWVIYAGEAVAIAGILSMGKLLSKR